MCVFWGPFPSNEGGQMLGGRSRTVAFVIPPVAFRIGNGGTPRSIIRHARDVRMCSVMESFAPAASRASIWSAVMMNRIDTVPSVESNCTLREVAGSSAPNRILWRW